MPYTITCFGWYVLGKLSDNLEQSSFSPLTDNPFILLYHGMLQWCPIMSFTEVDNTVTFKVSFMNISNRIPGIQDRNKLYWSYQLECWAWRSDLPSAHLTEISPLFVPATLVFYSLNLPGSCLLQSMSPCCSFNPEMFFTQQVSTPTSFEFQLSCPFFKKTFMEHLL